MSIIRDRRVARSGHNGGPPLDDYAGPRWGKGDPSIFLHWERAHRAAWRGVSRDVMLRRLAKAEACGLSYDEYTLEILERGRYLQPDDTAEIAAVKARRKRTRRRSRVPEADHGGVSPKHAIVPPALTAPPGAPAYPAEP